MISVLDPFKKNFVLIAGCNCVSKTPTLLNSHRIAQWDFCILT